MACAWIGGSSAAMAHHHLAASTHSGRVVEHKPTAAHSYSHSQRYRGLVLHAFARSKASQSEIPHSGRISPGVIKALQTAQLPLKAEPSLLLGIAVTESSLNPRAHNRHSSARGLLQFTNATWLTVVRDFGARHGLATYAAAIDTDQDGHLSVRNRRVRCAILALRDNPMLEAVMTVDRLEQQRGALEVRLGRPVQAADLYFLHLLGPAGAAHFLSVMALDPKASSVVTVGAAAMKNAGLFLKDGQPMTVTEAYARIQRTLDQGSLRHGNPVSASLVTVADIR